MVSELQCETHELPSNVPQALVMAKQLRESPSETAGNLIPGKWEADLGQGCDRSHTTDACTGTGVKWHI